MVWHDYQHGIGDWLLYFLVGLMDEMAVETSKQ
jgi:hypothetical protein